MNGRTLRARRSTFRRESLSKQKKKVYQEVRRLAVWLWVELSRRPKGTVNTQPSDERIKSGLVPLGDVCNNVFNQCNKTRVQATIK